MRKRQLLPPVRLKLFFEAALLSLLLLRCKFSKRTQLPDTVRLEFLAVISSARSSLMSDVPEQQWPAKSRRWEEEG